MNDEDFEHALRNLMAPGDSRGAIEQGGGIEQGKRRKKRLIFSILIPVFSVSLALAIAIPLTIKLNSTTSNDLAGGGFSDSPIAFLKDFSQYYYPYPVTTLKDQDGVYGECYYSFNDKNEEFLTMHIDMETIRKTDAFAQDGTSLSSSLEANSYFGFSGMSLSFRAVLEDKNNSSHSFDVTDLDLTPYYNFVTLH
jgi:hypothetical protein